jgi:hypothetical protein
LHKEFGTLLSRQTISNILKELKAERERFNNIESADMFFYIVARRYNERKLRISEDLKGAFYEFTLFF